MNGQLNQMLKMSLEYGSGLGRGPANDTLNKLVGF